MKSSNRLLAIFAGLFALSGCMGRETTRPAPNPQASVPDNARSLAIGDACSVAGGFTTLGECTASAAGVASGCYFSDLSGNGLMCWRAIGSAPAPQPAPPPQNPGANPFPAPNHALSFGYYYADGRYGDHTSEVFPYTNLYVALNRGYDSASDWRPQFRESIRRAGEAGKDIFLLPAPDEDWDEVLSIVAPYWSRVSVIEIAHEADLTIAQTEALAAALNRRIDARGLSRKTLGITMTQTQSLGIAPSTGDAMFAPSVGFVAMEAYVDPPGSGSSAANVADLNSFLDRAKARVPAGKQIGIIMQSYDRNGLWPNIGTLADIQAPAYLKAYSDPRVTMLLMFAYARPGGARDHASLGFVHRQMGASILGLAAPTPPAAPPASPFERVGTTFDSPVTPGQVRHVLAAYDSAHQAYFVVTGNGRISGSFVSQDGAPLGAPADISQTAAWTQSPGVDYSPESDVSLVAWFDSRSGGVTVRGRLVRGSGGSLQFLGPDFELDPGPADPRAPLAVAYSSQSREFLVAWPGSLPDRNLVVRGTRVDTSGNIRARSSILMPSEGWYQDVHATYNAATNEFLVAASVASDSAKARIQRVQAGTGNLVGAYLDVVTGLPGVWTPKVVYNSATGQYLVAWWQGGGSTGAFGQVLGADLGRAGAVFRIAAGYGSYDAIDLAYNRLSGTFLAVFTGNTAEAYCQELRSDGSPTGAVIQATVTAGSTIGNFNPRVVASASRREWLILAARDYNRAASQRITQTGAAPSPGPTPGPTITPPPPPPPAPTPAPTPAPPPAPTPGTCEAGGAYTQLPSCSAANAQGCYFHDLTGRGLMCWSPLGGTPAPQPPAPPLPPPPPPSPPAPSGCEVIAGEYTQLSGCSAANPQGCYFHDATGNGLMCWKGM